MNVSRGKLTGVKDMRSTIDKLTCATPTSCLEVIGPTSSGYTTGSRESFGRAHIGAAALRNIEESADTAPHRSAGEGKAQAIGPKPA
jgi:hypothetical protein